MARQTNTPQPKRSDGTKVNLFCSGHAFLPDGRLLVVGRPIWPTATALNQAALYDSTTNTPGTPYGPYDHPLRGEQVADDGYPHQPARAFTKTATWWSCRGATLIPNLPRPAPGRQTRLSLICCRCGENGAWKVIQEGRRDPAQLYCLPLYIITLACTSRSDGPGLHVRHLTIAPYS